MTNLSQINIGYNPVEDRLLLRMTSGSADGVAEYRMWMTRRFVRLMWNALSQSLDQDTASDHRIEPAGREAVREFEEEAALSSADFSTPYKPRVVSTPLGPEPVLISRLQIRKEQDGKKVMSLLDRKNQGLTLGLTTGMIHSLRKILVDAVLKANWNLDMSLFSHTQPDEDEPHTIQ